MEDLFKAEALARQAGQDQLSQVLHLEVLVPTQERLDQVLRLEVRLKGQQQPEEVLAQEKER